MSDNPIDNYDQKNVSEVGEAVSPYANGLDHLSDADVVDRLDLIEAVYDYERANKDRVTATGAIEDVRDALAEEAAERGLTTPEDDSDALTNTPDDADPGETDPGDAPTDSDADAESGPDDAEPVAADEEEEEDEDEEEADPDDDDVDESTAEPEPEDDPGFEGVRGRKRVLVRNYEKTSKRVAGKGFDAGEVKDLVLDDRVRQAIERNELQVVSG